MVNKQSAVVEVLSGIYHYLPNTFTVALMVGGIFMGKIAWILIAIGAITLTMFISILQGAVTKFWGPIGTFEGAATVQACSILPSNATTYDAFPSLWMSVSSFYLVYILRNAYSVYTTRPMNLPNESLMVQHRKSVGMVSMITTVILMLFIIVPRMFMSECETKYGAGSLLGLFIGGLAGYGWWKILSVCGPDVSPDIHGVMIGLQPGKFTTV